MKVACYHVLPHGFSTFYCTFYHYFGWYLEGLGKSKTIRLDFLWDSQFFAYIYQYLSSLTPIVMKQLDLSVWSLVRKKKHKHRYPEHVHQQESCAVQFSFGLVVISLFFAPIHPAASREISLNDEISYPI